jgi:uncharacterized membrane protein
MAFCGNCGATVTQTTGFCGTCGKPVSSSTSAGDPAPNGNPSGANGSGWSTVASQPTIVPTTSAGGWSQGASQPLPVADPSSNAGWTPTPPPPAPMTTPAPSQGWTSTPAPVQASSNWSTPAVGAPAANWNASGAPPAAAVAPGMAVAAGTGLTPNIAGALAYSLGIITGILFLVLEPYRRDRFVRFHAMQSILYFVAAVAFNIAWSIIVGFLIDISGWFALISLPIRLLISLGLFGLWLFAMFQAYNQKEFRIPILGAIAAKQAG